MKNKKKILSQYKRKIHINEEEWSYDVKGRTPSSMTLLICNPERTDKYQIPVNLSLDYEFYECDKYCGCKLCCSGNIPQKALTPSDVKEIIIKHSPNKFKFVKRKKKDE